ncbi:ATPase, partial [candidate division KSB1 bacterium]|nr:ATPase [candidate division KSB1 bacterium]
MNSTQNSWHTKSIEQVLEELSTDAQNGLSSGEAATRLKKYGVNELTERIHKKPFIILIEQFKSTLILILIVAAVISGFLGKPVETVAIFAIVLLFAILSFVQEYRAEKAMVALKRLTVPLVKVHRNETLVEISA